MATIGAPVLAVYANCPVDRSHMWLKHRVFQPHMKTEQNRPWVSHPDLLDVDSDLTRRSGGPLTGPHPETRKMHYRACQQMPL
jgi:hypothetical protein